MTTHMLLFFHILLIIYGLSFNGKTWTDNDLEIPYGFETIIKCKKEENLLQNQHYIN